MAEITINEIRFDDEIYVRKDGLKDGSLYINGKCVGIITIDQSGKLMTINDRAVFSPRALTEGFAEPSEIKTIF